MLIHGTSYQIGIPIRYNRVAESPHICRRERFTCYDAKGTGPQNHKHAARLNDLQEIDVPLLSFISQTHKSSCIEKNIIFVEFLIPNSLFIVIIEVES
jgi:hypothetical protein